jgi:hypothetical protein
MTMAKEAPIVFVPLRPDGTPKTKAEWEPWEQQKVAQTQATLDAWEESHSDEDDAPKTGKGKSRDK